MGEQPFIGSAALAAGTLDRYELRKYYTAIMPNVYLDKRIAPSLRQRITAAWLWSRRQAVIAGAAASALDGAKWVNDDAIVELIWRNNRSPAGVMAKAGLLPNWRRRWISSTPALSHRKKPGLRLLLINAGFPRPRTQIPVLGPDGDPKYFLDLGWADIMWDALTQR